MPMRLFILNFILFTILFPNFLNADGFKKGRLFLNVQGGQGLNVLPAGTLEKRAEDYSTPVITGIRDNQYAVTSNSSPIISYFLDKEFTDKVINLNNQSLGIGFEYGIGRQIGVGLSYEKLNINASNFLNVDRGLLLFHGLSVIPSISPSPVRNYFFEGFDYSNFLTLLFQSPTNIVNANFASANFYFHILPEKSWDPYVKLGIGVGRELNSNIPASRFGAAIGLRYHFLENFFVETEMEALSTTFHLPKQPSAIRYNYRNSGNYQEINGKFGVGMAFFTGETEEEIVKPKVIIPRPVQQADITNNTSKTSSIETKSDNSKNSNSSSKESQEDIAKNTSTTSSSKQTNLNDSKISPVQNEDQIIEKMVFKGKEIFQLPSTKLTSSGKQKLKIVADRIKKLGDKSYAIITTNTSPYDEIAPGKFENHELGIKRAKRIGKFLESLSLSENQIITTSFGSTYYDEDPNENIIIEIRSPK